MSCRRRPGPAAPARAWRAGAFAGTSAALSWIAHAVGGGALPDVWLLGIAALALSVLAYPVLRQEATGPRILLALAGAQALLHAWLAWTGSHHNHGGGGVPVGMLAAHGAATVAAAVWLRFAEQRLWRAARDSWVRLILWRRRWVGLPPIHASRAGMPIVRPGRWAPSQPLVSAHLVRGPPRALATG